MHWALRSRSRSWTTSSFSSNQGAATDGATAQRTPPRGAFLATGLDHDHRTLHLADRALHDYYRSHWPRLALCWSRLERIGGPGPGGTALQSGNSLSRV